MFGLAGTERLPGKCPGPHYRPGDCGTFRRPARRSGRAAESLPLSPRLPKPPRHRICAPRGSSDATPGPRSGSFWKEAQRPPASASGSQLWTEPGRVTASLFGFPHPTPPTARSLLRRYSTCPRLFTKKPMRVESLSLCNLVGLVSQF